MGQNKQVTWEIQAELIIYAKYRYQYPVRHATDRFNR